MRLRLVVHESIEARVGIRSSISGIDVGGRGAVPVFGPLRLDAALRARGGPPRHPSAFGGLVAGRLRDGAGLPQGRSVKVFWAKAEYPAIVTLPVAWLAVTLQFTGRGHLLKTRTLLALSIVPVATVLLAWTNEAHGLIWSSVEVEPYAGISVLLLGHGLAFWIHTAYAYLVIIAGIIFLADALHHETRLYLEQGLALLVSVLAPWVLNWFYTATISLDPPIDLTPFGFVVSVAVLAWALHRRHLFNILPVARKAVLRDIDIGVLVLDSMDRVADLNGAAERIIGTSARSAVGTPVSSVWPTGAELVRRSESANGGREDLTLTQSGSSRTFDVAVAPFDDDIGRPVGRVITIQDITERKRTEQELKLLRRRQEEIQEAERRDIARELHDQIGQELTALKFSLEATLERPESSVKATLGKLVGSANDMIEQVRNLSLALRPSVLDDFGLVPALDWFARRLAADGMVRVNLEHDGMDRRFPAEIETTVYRIVQEGLNNVARHAQVNEATVSVESTNSTISLVIEDEGAGFDIDSLPEANGIGLPGMRERAERLGGGLTVESSPGNGTRLRATVQIDQAG